MPANLVIKKFPFSRRLLRILVVIATVTIFAGLVIVPLEAVHPEGQIRSVIDGVWWSVTTMTTVGYGDLVPVTNGGRILGMVLQISGVTLFGLLVATIAVHLTQAQDEYNFKRLHEILERLEDENKHLRHKIDFLIKNKSNSKETPRRWGI